MVPGCRDGCGAGADAGLVLAQQCVVCGEDEIVPELVDQGKIGMSEELAQLLQKQRTLQSERFEDDGMEPVEAGLELQGRIAHLVRQPHGAFAPPADFRVPGPAVPERGEHAHRHPAFDFLRRIDGKGRCQASNASIQPSSFSP